MDRILRLEQAIDGGDEVLRIGVSSEGLGICIAFRNGADAGCSEVDERCTIRDA